MLKNSFQINHRYFCQMCQGVKFFTKLGIFCSGGAPANLSDRFGNETHFRLRHRIENYFRILLPRFWDVLRFAEEFLQRTALHLTSARCFGTIIYSMRRLFRPGSWSVASIRTILIVALSLAMGLGSILVGLSERDVVWIGMTRLGTQKQ